MEKEKLIDRRAALKRMAALSLGIVAAGVAAKEAFAGNKGYGYYCSSVVDYESNGHYYYSTVCSGESESYYCSAVVDYNSDGHKYYSTVCDSH